MTIEFRYLPRAELASPAQFHMTVILEPEDNHSNERIVKPQDPSRL
jgi:hypothetical protein